MNSDIVNPIPPTTPTSASPPVHISGDRFASPVFVDRSDAATIPIGLPAASPKMMLMPMGTSTQGRTYWVALISNEKNLARIDRYREIARRLASTEGLTEDQARALAKEGKAIVHIDGGLHSSEVAGPQHTLQLAYDMVSTHPNEPGRDEQIQRILDNVILMLWPTINPDGHQMVADYYMKNVGTPGAGTVRTVSSFADTESPEA